MANALGLPDVRRQGAPMASLLELPAVRRRVAPISLKSYHALIERGSVSERTELLRGVIIEKTTKSPLHVMMVNRLCELVAKAAAPGSFVRKEDPMTLSDSEPEPDVAVVTGRPEDFRTAHPTGALLVAEVSVSSEELDREKIALYAEAGVAEFWLVLPATGEIEAYSRPQGSAYREWRRYKAGETLWSHAVSNLQIEINALFG